MIALSSMDERDLNSFIIIKSYLTHSISHNRTIISDNIMQSRTISLKRTRYRVIPRKYKYKYINNNINIPSYILAQIIT